MVVDTPWILAVFASLTAISFAEPEFHHHGNSSLVEKIVHKKVKSELSFHVPNVRGL